MELGAKPETGSVNFIKKNLGFLFVISKSIL
jgi:hypothetical protein